jgi:hypothetical protein
MYIGQYLVAIDYSTRHILIIKVISQAMALLFKKLFWKFKRPRNVQVLHH